MAGPLAGIGQQQQIPLATALQQGGGVQNRQQGGAVQDQQNPQQQTGQAAQTPANAPVQSQQAETGNQDALQAQQQEVSAPQNRSVEGDEPRGSVVDITV